MTTRCVHHWRIATPAGPVVDGVCLKCGAARAYRSSEERAEDSGYNGAISPNRMRGDGRR